MRVGVVVFPGSNCDRDALHAARLAGAEAVPLWHETPDLQGADLVILPGGFAYGDYLRAGVLARFSPIMAAVRDHAARGGLVLGICNGFQVLAEAGLVPGALLRNASLRFEHRWVRLSVERRDTPFTRAVPEGMLLRMPVAHGEGCYLPAGRRPRPARGRRPGPVPLRRAGGEPERIAPRHRRRAGRRGPGVRPDAPSRSGPRRRCSARTTACSCCARSSRAPRKGSRREAARMSATGAPRVVSAAAVPLHRRSA